MKNAVVIDSNEVKAILAKHFGVPESNIIKMQYSYAIITEGGNASIKTEEG